MKDYWQRFILPPGDERLFTTSSYDVTGRNDDGFDGTYSYLYHDSGDIASPVIFETAGPGMLNLLRTGGVNDGELLVYLDGDDAPTYRLPFDDLYGGKTTAAPAGRASREKPGHGSAWAFLDLAYKSGCRLVAHGVSGTYKFYNVFATRGGGCRPAGAPPAPEHPGTLARYKLMGYSRCTLASFDGPGTIAGIFLRIPERAHINRALRNLRLRAFWEGERQAAVDAPAGLLFGVGYTGTAGDYPSYELPKKVGSLYIPTGRCAPVTPCFGELDEGFYFFGIPMPFALSAKVEVLNTGNEEIAYEADVTVSPCAPPAGFSHLYAIHRREDNLLPGCDYTVLSVRGSGYFLGGVYRMLGRCYDPLRKQVQRIHLEGDARFYIDDARGFLNAATGTEEYFNWGWYDTNGDNWPGDDRPFAFPTHGYTEHIVSLEDCSTMYRLHTLDPVPFHRALDFRLEHGPDGREPADYESVAFCYINPEYTARLISIVNRLETCTTRYQAMQVWEGNDQVTVDEMRKHGDDWLQVGGQEHEVSVVKGETVFSVSVPDGSRRLVIRRQYDGAWTDQYCSDEPDGAKILCAQEAEVSLNGKVCGIWRLPPRHARQCWMQDDFSVALDGSGQTLSVSIRNLKGAGWNACAYWALIG
jgi:hypothetical protein